ncbi:MAG TPA: mercuric reductase [Gammaproteobacteria bacterium]|nr:mercuric reductase [Gammaproteobacteria bacterium]
MPQLESPPSRDEFDWELQRNVRPADWVNPTPADRYNLVVIGAGTAGLVSAAGAASLGARVALVERGLMGGDCLNVGCVPSKAMLSSANRAAALRDAADFGVRARSGYEVDFGAVMRRLRRLRASLSHHDSAARFAELGVDVFLGDGRFVDAETVEVDGQRLKFRKAVIATGGRAAAPAIPGLDTVSYLTNESVFSLTERPSRVGVIGAGPIGCELAQAFARLGSDVHLFEARHGVLPNEDPEASELVQAALQKDGVRLLCCGHDLRVRPDAGGIRLSVGSHDAEVDLVVDELLVAVGRAPNVEGLELEAADVAYTDKGLIVDDRLRTSNPRIFAAGDVCSAYKFTHAADFMARLAIQNALFKGRRRFSALTVPWCTYTQPELARVGLDGVQAQERGVAIDTYTQPFGEVDRAVLAGEAEGFVRVHTRRGTDQIVGATVVGAQAGDLIAHLTFAMTHGLGLKALGATIHPYPTHGEAIRKLGDQYNRRRLTPMVAKAMAAWMRWTR